MTPSGWITYCLDVLLRPVQRIEPVVSSCQYDLLGVRWYAAGCHKHSEAMGDALKTPTLNRVQAGDVTYNKMWTSKNAFAIVPDDLAGCYATSEYPLFENKRPDLLDIRFLEQVFKRGLLAEEAGALRRGSTSRARLNPLDFLGLSLSIPPVLEQQKIAAILASVDDAIHATQAVIDQARKVRVGILEDLLTRGINCLSLCDTLLGPRPSHWPIITLGSVIKDSRYGTSEKCASQPPGLPVLRIPNILSGRVNFDDLKFASLPESEIARLKLTPGDILVVRTNGNPTNVGRVAVVPQHTGSILYASYLIRLRLKTESAIPEFVAAVLSQSQTREYIEKTIRTSAGNFNINGTELASIPLALPPVAEQQAIVSILRELDQQLDESEKTAASLALLKKGLMADLLTGRTRVEVAV